MVNPGYNCKISFRVCLHSCGSCSIASVLQYDHNSSNKNNESNTVKSVCSKYSDGFPFKGVRTMPISSNYRSI